MQKINEVLAENQLLTSSVNPAKTQISTSTLKTSDLRKLDEMKKSSTSIKSEITNKHIETLFIRFTAIYGHYWLNSYQNEKVLDTAKKEWLESLLPFKAKTLKEALLIIKKQSHYPPSLPIFVDCCKAIEARYKLLIKDVTPIKKSAPDVVKRYITKMNDYLHKHQ